MIKESLSRLIVLSAVVLSSVLPVFPGNSSREESVFTRTVPSGGVNTIILPVEKWERYSLRTTGEEPVALSVADRRNGIFIRDGAAGERNARIDLFLDIGEYKLQTQGLKTAKGEATVRVLPFTFPSDFKPSYLVPLREINLELRDMQQLAFWFEVDSDTTIYIEATGRCLEDMRLWRNGEWIIETQDYHFTHRITPETPLKGIAMVARLQKGTYMAGVYGGPGLSWSLDSTDYPFYIQYGIEQVPENSISSLTIPAKGYLQLLIAPGTQRVIVEQADKSRLFLEGSTGDNFFQHSRAAIDSIHSKSATPRASILFNSYMKRRAIRITGKPGQTITLQTMGRLKSEIYSKEESEYWISSFHSGNHNDQIGASGVIINLSDSSILALEADTVSHDRGMARKFNLLQSMNTFVWVDSGGKYTITPGGTGASWRIYRYYLKPPKNFKYPDFRSKPRNVDLNRGLYRLDLTPESKGVTTLKISRASLADGIISAGKAVLSMTDDNQVWDPPRRAVQFPKLKISPETRFRIVLNDQSPETYSVSVRKLPVNPEEPLTIWSKPGHRVNIPLKLEKRRFITVTDESCRMVPFIINGKTYENGVELDSGTYSLTIREKEKGTRFLSLKAVAPERKASSPIPAFPDRKRDALPGYTSVEPGKVVYFDLDRESSKSFAFEVKEPAFYRIETTGRLATRLSLRDRFSVFKRSAQQNGIGRNAMLIVYLLTGKYQIDATTLDRSSGHLGLTVYLNPLIDGGLLEKDLDNRTMVPAFSGVTYNLNVPSDGTYRIESIGQKGNFTIRLEDMDGWPFEPVENKEPYQCFLNQGTFRLISLPYQQDSRRIARLTAIGETRKIKGKGPHVLELNTPVSSTWTEENPEKKDNPGAPVVFTFNLPAPITSNLSISDGFRVSLYKNNSGSPEFTFSGRKKSDLEKGNYRLLVEPLRKGNLAPYQVSVNTNDLIDNLSYNVTRPKTIRVSVGNTSVVELMSQGTLDVSAQLLDESAKKVIASNDDSYLDWNFAISRILKPGRYFLKINSPEEQFTSTRVFMRSLADTLMDTIYSSGTVKTIRCNLNRHIGIFPVSLSDTGDVICCALQGSAQTGCSIERRVGSEWLPIAQSQGISPAISAPKDREGEYRIRVWSDYTVNKEITVSCVTINTDLYSWKDISGGFTVSTQPLGENHCAWFKVDLQDRAPGHFRMKGDQVSAISVSTAIDSIFQKESSPWFSSTERYAWVELKFDREGKFRAKFEPVVLENGQSLTVDLSGSSPCIFDTKQAGKSVALLSVISEGNHPLSGVLRGGTENAHGFNVCGISIGSDVWFSDGKCATVSLPEDKDKIAVWNSLPVSDGTDPVAHLTWSELPLSDLGEQSHGVFTWTPEKPSARKINFPKGSRYRLRVTIPSCGAALIVNSDGTRVLDVAKDESKVKDFTGQVGALYLLGFKEGKGFSITSLELSSGQEYALEKALKMGDKLEVKTLKEGTMILPLPLSLSSSKKNLYYSGAVNAVNWTGRDGLLRKSIPSGTSVGPGGLLTVDHGRGWIKMDLCGGSSRSAVIECKWGQGFSSSKETKISKSSQVRLSGATNWFSFDIKDTRHVNLGVPCPLSAILLKDGKAVHYQEALELFNWDLPLVKGKYRLGIHPIAGSNLDGAELSVIFRPVEKLSEKSPFSAFIAPGESRMLSFDVSQKSAFGIGLRQTRETANAVLFDNESNPLAVGKQQFLKLDKGTYYLWIRIPSSAEGTECTVFLFGQEPPPNEPPEKLVKWFISGAEGPRPFYSQTEDKF